MHNIIRWRVPTTGESLSQCGVVLTVRALLDASAGGVEAHRAPQVLRHLVVVDAGADPPTARGRCAAHGVRSGSACAGAGQRTGIYVSWRGGRSD